jgi:sigma factor-binding protein Crl
MSHPLPHRQLLKEFMTLGPYLRQEQCEPERYFFDCLAVCLNLGAEPESREFWGWWLVLEPREGGFICQSELGLYNKEGSWQERKPHASALDAVEGSRERFLKTLHAKLELWQLPLLLDESTSFESPSAA